MGFPLVYDVNLKIRASIFMPWLYHTSGTSKGREIFRLLVATQLHYGVEDLNISISILELYLTPGTLTVHRYQLCSRSQSERLDNSTEFRDLNIGLFAEMFAYSLTQTSLFNVSKQTCLCFGCTLRMRYWTRPTLQQERISDLMWSPLLRTPLFTFRSDKAMMPSPLPFTTTRSLH
jgi:hypothetical protein